MLTNAMVEREIIHQMTFRGMILDYQLPAGCRVLFGPNGFRVEWKGKIYDTAWSDEEIKIVIVKSLDDFSTSYITPLLDQINGKDPATIT